MKIVAVDIPMGDLVAILVKLGIAVIPAVILLTIVYAILDFVLTALGLKGYLAAEAVSQFE